MIKTFKQIAGFMRLSILIIVLVCMLEACSSKENKVIENNFPSELDSLFKLTRFDEIFSIGEIDLQYSDSSIISRISTSICIDEHKRIYVGQSNLGYILVFDEKGKFIRRIGRKGKGPGELFEVNSIDVKNGKIYVLGDLYISIFTDSGEFVKRFQYGNEFAPHIRIISSGRMIVFYTYAMTNKMCDVFDSGGQILQSWGEFEKESRTSYGGRVSLAVDELDNIYTINFYDPSVFKFNINGELLSRFSKDIKPFVDHDISRIMNANNPEDVFYRTLEGTVMEGVYYLKFKNYGLIIVESVKIDPVEMKVETRNLHIFNHEGKVIKNLAIPNNLNIVFSDNKDLYGTFQYSKASKELFEDNKNPMLIKISFRDSISQYSLIN